MGGEGREGRPEGGGSRRAGAMAASSAPGLSGPPGSPVPRRRRIASCSSGDCRRGRPLPRPLSPGAAVRRLSAPASPLGRGGGGPVWVLGSCSSRWRPCGEWRPRGDYSSRDALRGVVGRGRPHGGAGGGHRDVTSGGRGGRCGAGGGRCGGSGRTWRLGPSSASGVPPYVGRVLKSTLLPRTGRGKRP